MDVPDWPGHLAGRLTAHELRHERAMRSRKPGSADREPRVAAAA